MSFSGAAVRALVGALVFGMLNSAASADQVQATGQASDITILRQILDARSNGFASLKGTAQASDASKSASWNATLAPFGLTCKIFSGEDGTAFWCTNAAEQVAAQARAQSDATTIELPKTGLDDDAAHTLVQFISTAFRAASPGLNVYPGFSGGAEDEETLVGMSKREYSAAIYLVSFGPEGDKNNATVSFAIYAKPLGYDPARD
jgi:hypothetical protein